MSKEVICRKHWFTLVKPVLIFLLCVAVGVICLCFKGKIALLLWPGIIFLIAGVIFLAYSIGGYITSVLYIKEGILTARTGIFVLREYNTPAVKVSDIQVHTTVVGKIFGYGSIAVATPGTAGVEYNYSMMTHTEELKEAILDFQRTQAGYIEKTEGSL